MGVVGEKGKLYKVALVELGAGRRELVVGRVCFVICRAAKVVRLAGSLRCIGILVFLWRM